MDQIRYESFSFRFIYFVFLDSYLENQRRRALRDTQGYYFPYKKYTLKDYRDIQKTNNANPFSETNETTIDRVKSISAKFCFVSN